MKKLLRTLAMILTLSIGVSLISGCGKSNSNGNGNSGNGSTNNNSSYDLYIYNSKGENAEKFEQMAAAYTDETGVKLKTFSIGSGQDHMETLRSEMNSNNKPTIFTIQGVKELAEWEQGGYVLDLNNATEESFKSLVSEIPESLRLTSDKSNSFGVPYGLEGYGYVVDRQMVSDLFGSGSVDSFLKDIKLASYSEFESMVKTIDKYIKSPTAGKVTLNGKTYQLESSKKGLAKNLTGVFAVAGSESWTYGDHMVNVALDAVFDSPLAASKATDSQLDSLRNPLIKYAQALDLKTSYVAGANGALKRGSEFINSTTNGYDQAVKNFADGKAMFIKQGNWVYSNISNMNSDIVNRLTIVPIKMPFVDSDIKVSGLTANKMNRSIPVFVPMYYAINSKSSEKEQKLAQQFLVWLNTSETGKKYVIEEFGFIPYNIEDTSKITNSVNKSILEYKAAGDMIPAAYNGSPASWSSSTFGLKIMEEYLVKPTWTKGDYEAIADYAIKSWKEMKNQ